eukprot:215760-Prymnesium_polylepis.1
MAGARTEPYTEVRARLQSRVHMRVELELGQWQHLVPVRVPVEMPAPTMTRPSSQPSPSRSIPPLPTCCATFANMLCNQKPVTRQKKPKRQGDRADQGQQAEDRGSDRRLGLQMADLRRPECDGTAFTKTSWAVDTPIEMLKTDCSMKNFDAILIINDTVNYGSYSFKVTPDDCLDTVDHSCE